MSSAYHNAAAHTGPSSNITGARLELLGGDDGIFTGARSTVDQMTYATRPLILRTAAKAFNDSLGAIIRREDGIDVLVKPPGLVSGIATHETPQANSQSQPPTASSTSAQSRSAAAAQPYSAVASEYCATIAAICNSGTAHWSTAAHRNPHVIPAEERAGHRLEMDSGTAHELGVGAHRSFFSGGNPAVAVHALRSLEERCRNESYLAGQMAASAALSDISGSHASSAADAAETATRLAASLVHAGNGSNYSGGSSGNTFGSGRQRAGIDMGMPTLHPRTMVWTGLWCVQTLLPFLFSIVFLLFFGGVRACACVCVCGGGYVLHCLDHGCSRSRAQKHPPPPLHTH